METRDQFLPLTGFSRLDEAPRKAPKHNLGGLVLKDPTFDIGQGRVEYFPRRTVESLKYETIDKAYDIDSYIRAGIDKYVELCVKQGWELDCESPEPREYLTKRFQLIAIMCDKSFGNMIVELVHDFIKYGNAFWIKVRQPAPDGVPWLPKQGLNGLQPVVGYFRADPKKMKPISNKSGKQLMAWQFVPEFGKPKIFNLEDIVHFPFNMQVSTIWGLPSITPVIEDVRAYRQAEEYVIRLLYKHLNPLMHHEVPGVDGEGMGRQEDVDAAYAAHTTVAPDGMIVTPPGHKISMVGAESRAIRGEGYMKMLRERIYAGLGLNSVVMGEGQTTSAGSADAMTATMHNRAKLYQRELADILTDKVIYELLLEGGFDPLNNQDYTRWMFREIEIDTQIKRENHVIQLFTNGLINEDEGRRRIGDKPMTPAARKLKYIYTDKIPVVKAQAAAKAAMGPGGGGGDPTSKTGAAKQVDSKNNPANQHGKTGGPKIKHQ
jgi:hypothetical protein